MTPRCARDWPAPGDAATIGIAAIVLGCIAILLPAISALGASIFIGSS